MIITLIGQEKNIGLFTLSDYIVDKLGKGNVAIMGWNYLLPKYQEILDKINEAKTTRSVIVKYVIPRLKFTNQEIVYPAELDEISDVIFYVPTYREELAPVVNLKFFKGEDNPFTEHFKNFYK